MGRGHGGTASPRFFGLKFVQKLVHCCNCILTETQTHTHTHTHSFNGPFSATTGVSRYQKGKTYLDFTEAKVSEWQWHQRGHMQVCISLQTDNRASTPPLSFLQAGCPSCRPTNSVRALKAQDKFSTAELISVCYRHSNTSSGI